MTISIFVFFFPVFFLLFDSGNRGSFPCSISVRFLFGLRKLAVFMLVRFLFGAFYRFVPPPAPRRKVHSGSVRSAEIRGIYACSAPPPYIWGPPNAIRPGRTLNPPSTTDFTSGPRSPSRRRRPPRRPIFQVRVGRSFGFNLSGYNVYIITCMILMRNGEFR